MIRSKPYIDSEDYPVKTHCSRCDAVWWDKFGIEYTCPECDHTWEIEDET